MSPVPKPRAPGVDFLGPDEVKMLVRRYQRTGDVRAADMLLRAYLRLIAKIAREYLWSRQDLDDLIQEGSVGFLRSLTRFDPSRGIQLPTYAAFWVRAMIMRFILDNWRLVRVGTTPAQRYELFHAHRRDPAVPTSEKTAALRRHILSSELTLDAPLRRGDGELTISRIELLRAADDTRPDVQYEELEQRAATRDLLATFARRLRGRERLIFEARWRLDDQRYTLAELGDRFGVSRERVRQIEERMLDRLRKYVLSRGGARPIAARRAAPARAAS